MADPKAMALSKPATPAGKSEPRDQWLTRVLLDHEHALLDRDPTLVAGKLAKMAKTPFAFFRGTAWLAADEASPFKTVASSQIALVGDPHPENVGTVVDARGTRHLEFNDFDLADFGSYLDDLRRLATGFWIITDMGKMKPKKQADVVGEVVDGYIAEVQQLSRGQRAIALTEDLLGDTLPAVLNEPDEPPTNGDPASKTDQALVREILSGYPTSLPRSAAVPGRPADTRAPARVTKEMLAIKRVVRRHAGVASFPLLRFQVLVEGPSTSDADDWILELKESTGAPATRVIAIQKQFHEVADSDAFVGWANVGGQEFRVRRVDPTQRRLSAEQLAKRIKKDDLRKPALKILASSLGHLLARGHCQALDRGGRPGLRAIADALAAGRGAAAGGGLAAGSGLKEELIAYAERTGTSAEQDVELLRGLLASKGPTLGWRAGGR